MKFFYYFFYMHSLVLSLLLFVISTIAKADPFFSGPPSADLDQARNGTDNVPLSPVEWVNGNAGNSTAHYIEGMSIPYRCEMTNLTVGAQGTITLGYDVKNSGKHAIDYLTQHDRLLPHDFVYHSTAETIDPFLGSSLSAGSVAFSTSYAIPPPSSAGSPMAGQPTTSFNSLTGADNYMLLHNGRIDTIYYASEGDLTATSSETQIVIKFTVGASTALLLWGGHIASRNDWGYVNGEPQSAGGISGSPFHMRLKSWSFGSVGNQDRSLAGSSVVGPPSPLPVVLLSFEGRAVEDRNELYWTTASEINSDYFEIQKSSDGITFHKAGIVKAAGNSTSILNYEFTDKNPFYINSYYRLNQVDYDGKNTYYKIISVRNRNFKVRKLVIYNLNGIPVRTIDPIRNDYSGVENPSSNIIPPDLPSGFYIFQYNDDKDNVIKRTFINVYKDIH